MFAPPVHAPPLVKEREPVNFTALLHMLDTEFSAVAPDIIRSFKFDFQGMPFDIRRIAHEKGFRFLVTTTVGYLPFSIESSERRQAIRQIVEATQLLPTVHFTIDPASKIIAGGVFEVSKGIDPAFFFYPLVLFLQEARPFMELVGRFLLPSSQGA
jgi:hypothetical protein